MVVAVRFGMIGLIIVCLGSFLDPGFDGAMQALEYFLEWGFPSHSRLTLVSCATSQFSPKVQNCRTSFSAVPFAPSWRSLLAAGKPCIARAPRRFMVSNSRGRHIDSGICSLIAPRFLKSAEVNLIQLLVVVGPLWVWMGGFEALPLMTAIEVVFSC